MEILLTIFLLLGFIPDAKSKHNLHPLPLGGDAPTPAVYELLACGCYLIAMKKIPLTNSRKFALVDDEDYEELIQKNWHITKKGSIARCQTVHRRGIAITICVLMHRVVMSPPKGLQIDHINRIKNDNQKHNLRFATNQQNQGNVPARKVPKTSRYKGVHWDRASRCWRSEVGRQSGKRMYLGQFNSQIEAARAYNKAAKIYFGEFAFLNKV